jgi:lipoate---protein ligase
MDMLDLTLPTVAENLALDEALLLEAEAGRLHESLRLWEWPKPAVVLGAGGRLTEEINESTCHGDGVPIHRRASGGGTVMLGKGCFLFSLVLAYARSPDLREIPTSYCHILGTIRDALLDRHAGVACAGTSDLAIAGRKFSGNSQQRKRHYLLHHGTILYGFPLETIGRYLHQPPRQPDYRGNRTHGDFLMNLPMTADTLKQRLRVAWQAEKPLLAWPEEAVRRLTADKYATTEWTRRR